MSALVFNRKILATPDGRIYEYRFFMGKKRYTINFYNGDIQIKYIIGRKEYAVDSNGYRYSIEDDGLITVEGYDNDHNIVLDQIERLCSMFTTH